MAPDLPLTGTPVTLHVFAGDFPEAFIVVRDLDGTLLVDAGAPSGTPERRRAFYRRLTDIWSRLANYPAQSAAAAPTLTTKGREIRSEPAGRADARQEDKAVKI